MSIEELGSLGEFVAAFAVLITLIYLTIQIKQSKVATRASAHRDTIGMWVQMNLGFANNADSRSIIKKAMVDQAAKEDFDSEEWHHLALCARTVFLNAEEMFYQYQHHVIEQDVWEDYRERMVQMLKLPAFHTFWIEEPMGFTRGFCQELIAHGAPFGGGMAMRSELGGSSA